MNVKSIFFSQIKPFFKDKGYLFYDGEAPTFILKNSNYIIKEGFNYLSKANKIYGGKLALSIKEIEDVILEIQFPQHDFSNYLKTDENFLLTIGDKYGVLSVNNIELDSEEKITNYANAVKKYVETDGKIFIEKYSYLPNILLEMDNLESEGKYWNEILAGGPEFLFRGLIISKLCNDYDYERKLDYVKKLLISMADDFLPYYDKLKDKLTTVVPLYNI